MPTASTIKTSFNGPIATIQLNREKAHNAFNAKMIQELHNIFDEIEKNSTLRVVILTASGRHFCAGADLHWMHEMASYEITENYNDAFELASLLQKLSELSKPTIALVHGRVMGGGCGLSSCCDFVIASENTQFCFSEVKLGLIPATIAPYLLRRIGYQATRRYFLSAELIELDVAKHISLIDEVVSHDNLLASGLKLANILCENGPAALKTVKKLLSDLVPIDHNTIKFTADCLANTRSTAEAKEGIHAFLEKRAPHWIVKKEL